ncbi:MAG: ATP phosphoribosyltransferase regulatory subunit [Clostridia bacterium]|nr:ATP phosphoribosyltransferase regulatory subunit [Clostridia bacterium]
MKIKDSVLSDTERAVFCLRDLYRSYGYSQYKMSKFEEYDLYAKNKSFLISDSIITFTGIGGKLMALKPDVTLSIVKSMKDMECGVGKVYYNENVYRTEGSDGDFREIMQAGLECIGDIDDQSLSEVLLLAAKSLELISDDYVLDVSHLGIVSEAIEVLGIGSSAKKKVLAAIADKNLHSAIAICDEEGVEKEKTQLLQSIITLYGDPDTVLNEIEPRLTTEAGKNAAIQLRRLISIISDSIGKDKLRLDFSVTDDMSYYSGIVISGFIRGISKSILSGGQYDNLLRKMGKKMGAVGFALYLDRLSELEETADGYDVDVLLLYEENDSTALVRMTVDELVKSGKSVSAQKVIPEKLRYKQLIKLNEGEVQ